jgi:hypoxanthine-guanine phosphoribosyltransferase
MVKPENYNVLYTNTLLEGWEMTLGRYINEHHKQSPLPSTAVCVLDGAYQFFAKTCQYVAFDINLDFCRVNRENSSVMRFDSSVKPNNRIYIFCDVIDTGKTASIVADYYSNQFSVVELVLCAVADKSSTHVKQLEHNYTKIWSGFHLNDEWIVGYGMANPQGYMMQSPSILKLNPND